eukprot:1159271-Pelagomonas_calceolata.AAC.2
MEVKKRAQYNASLLIGRGKHTQCSEGTGLCKALKMRDMRKDEGAQLLFSNSPIFDSLQSHLYSRKKH